MSLQCFPCPSDFPPVFRQHWFQGFWAKIHRWQGSLEWDTSVPLDSFVLHLCIFFCIHAPTPQVALFDMVMSP